MNAEGMEPQSTPPRQHPRSKLDAVQLNGADRGYAVVLRFELPREKMKL